MGSDGSQNESIVRTAAQFATTHWSVVLAAGDWASPNSQEAVEKLCRQYWFPLYVFVRRKGYSPEDAQDLTQSFFASMFQRRAFGRADGRRGRFRTFLLSALQNHLRMERRAQVAMKRGSGRSMLASCRPISSPGRGWRTSRMRRACYCSRTSRRTTTIVDFTG